MTIPASIVGKVFLANQVGEGTASGTDPIVFTETRLLSDQTVFGSAIGPNATATVTSLTQDPLGNPVITVRIANSGTLADGQTVTGTVVGNDATDFLILGSLLGASTYLYVTNTPGQQPGVGKTANVAAESDNVPYTPACYCRGTAILTEHGEVPVEELQAGDRVVTASGALRPVAWVGRRSYGGRFLAGQDHLHPIRFQAGSLGANRPRRDLLVSPEHAMFIDGVLVPARLLANGTTIRPERGLRQVDYFHVELDSHDVLLAEGAPSESFVDDDSRGVFHNAAEWAVLHPGRPVAAPVYCAPRVEDGPGLDAIRRTLAPAHAA